MSFLAADPAATSERAMLDSLVAKLTNLYRDNATGDWRWFEPTLTYDNAILPLALFAAYGVTGDRTQLRDARESLEFLEEICFDGDRLQLVGNTGWHSRGGTKADADEQAIDAAAFVLAFRCAYMVTKDRHYLGRMRDAFAWFLGANRLGLPLYDFATGGCHDGMALPRSIRTGRREHDCFHVAPQMLELAAMARAQRRFRDHRQLHETHPDQAHPASNPSDARGCWPRLCTRREISSRTLAWRQLNHAHPCDPESQVSALTAETLQRFDSDITASADARATLRAGSNHVLRA